MTSDTTGAPAASAAAAPAGDPPGVRVAAVTEWFGAHIAGARPPLRFTLVAGGRSNFTYRVDDADGHTYVLRRPPLGELLPSAHDMGREYRIISALGRTHIPVAPALGFCDDPAVTDRPFYVMGFVDGHILRTRAEAERAMAPAAMRRAGESLIDVLADLHALDVDSVGLGDLGRRDAYIERQLRRWHGQFQQSKTREVPLVDDVHARLAASVPAQQGTAVVHGDYRLDNTMLGDDGRVMAVLDWEICTLGDALADVGLLLVYCPSPGDPLPLGETPNLAPGFPTRAELLERYAARSGRDLSRIGYYVAFGYWKLACILDGVYARYARGDMAADGYDFRALDEQVARLAEAADAALRASA